MIKKHFFSQSKHTFVLPKKIWADSINREKDVL